MKLGENHHIYLIKKNQELTDLARNAWSEYDAYLDKAVAAVGCERGQLIGSYDESCFIPLGCTVDLGRHFSKRKGEYYYPNKRLKAGKEVDAKLQELGSFEFRKDKWMHSKGIMHRDFVDYEGSSYFVSTTLTCNEDKTEFLLFLPKFENVEKELKAISELPGVVTEITYGTFLDNHKKTHIYRVM
jgi:hypothetical protein